MRFTVTHGDASAVKADPYAVLEPDDGWRVDRDLVITGHTYTPQCEGTDSNTGDLSPARVIILRPSRPRPGPTRVSLCDAPVALPRF